MEQVVIRQGNAQDVEQVMDLVRELALYERAPEEVTNTEEQMRRDGFGEHPAFGLFVAEINDTIVGIALHYVRYSTWKGKTIHLEDLIVKEDMRGSGLGFELYSKIIEQGKIDKVRRIEWAVLDWNISAIEFYQKSGAKILEDWRVAQMDENGINEFLSKL